MIMNDNMTRLQEMINKVKCDPELDMKINSMRNELTEMLGELAYFKNLQQQERLINLPCKPGDAVYLALYKEYYNDVYCQNEIRKGTFTPECLDQSFELKHGYFASKKEAEGYLLLRKKMDLAEHILRQKVTSLAVMNFDERYETLHKLCLDICKETGSDILSAEFVEAVNDYLETKISGWGFITLPADVQFESQTWEKMQKAYNEETKEEQER